MKKLTALVAFALLAIAGTGYATDNHHLIAMPNVSAPTPHRIVDRAAVRALGIDATIDDNIPFIVSTIPSSSLDGIGGKVGILTAVTLTGGSSQIAYLRLLTPCTLVDTNVDGGSFFNGETRRYLFPGGVRCSPGTPYSVPYPAKGIMVLLHVRMDVSDYFWSWGDNGPTLDFIGQPYSPDWYTMTNDRAFMFAPGGTTTTAHGEVSGYVALQGFPDFPLNELTGFQVRVAHPTNSKMKFSSRVIIDVLGYAVADPSRE